MSKPKKWIIAIAVVLLIVTAIVAIRFNPKKGLKLVLPDIDDITLINANINNDTASVGLNMVLENKSIFKLDLDTLFYKITLADSLLFQQTQVLGIRQKSGDIDTVVLPLKIPVKKIMRTVKSLQNQDSTYLDIETYIVYNTLIGRKKLPFSKKLKIKVPVPPQIKVNQVEMMKVKLGDKTVEINVDVTISNKGDMINLNIHEVRYDLTVGKNLVTSQGVYNKPIVIKPSSDTRLILPVTVKVNRMATMAWKYISNEEVPYQVTLRAKLDENSFYQKTDIPLEVKANGKTKLRK